MSKKVKGLRGLIYSKYDSEAALARTIEWPRQRLNKITSGVKEPTVGELNVLAEVLGVNVDVLAQFFCKENHRTSNKKWGENQKGA